MRRRVPLNAVRAFEAAARYRNLGRAADELCVTPTAVSHQVRLLEDFLQLKLFDRTTGRLELTRPAELCLTELTEALDQIDLALANVRHAQKRERLTVAASTSVASLWLLPRLQRFIESFPQIDVVLNAFSTRAGFESKGNDIAIGHWSAPDDRNMELLMEEEVIPVCDARLISAARTVDDALQELPLLHDDKRNPRANGKFPTWDAYFGEHGLYRADVNVGLRFNSSSLAVEAAIDGFGVLLGRGCLISEALRSKRLVRLADAYSVKFPYYIVSPKRGATPASRLFRDWLHSEAALTMAG